MSSIYHVEGKTSPIGMWEFARYIFCVVTESSRVQNPDPQTESPYAFLLKPLGPLASFGTKFQNKVVSSSFPLELIPQLLEHPKLIDPVCQNLMELDRYLTLQAKTNLK